MRKLCLLFTFLAAIMLVTAGAASADEKIGIADMQRVLLKHPRFESVSKRIEAVYRAKEKELKTALEKVTDKKVAAETAQAKRREVAQEEMKLKEPIYKEIRAAIRTVAKSKGITVVLERGAVQFGGIDVTEDIIKELNKKK